jgi:hypothetical protein
VGPFLKNPGFCPKRRAACQTFFKVRISIVENDFSKASALEHLLYKGTIESTCQNVYYCCILILPLLYIESTFRISQKPVPKGIYYIKAQLGVLFFLAQCIPWQIWLSPLHGKKKKTCNFFYRGRSGFPHSMVRLKKGKNQKSAA